MSAGSGGAVAPATANDRQPGGDHYMKKAIQPWDFITDNNMPYLDGNVVRYITRWRDKNGLDDLYKAQHYLEKIIENEKKRVEAELVKELTAEPTPTLIHHGNGVTSPIYRTPAQIADMAKLAKQARDTMDRAMYETLAGRLKFRRYTAPPPAPAPSPLHTKAWYDRLVSFLFPPHV